MESLWLLVAPECSKNAIFADFGLWILLSFLSAKKKDAIEDSRKSQIIPVKIAGDPYHMDYKILIHDPNPNHGQYIPVKPV